jgi:hypothetical protein
VEVVLPGAVRRRRTASDAGETKGGAGKFSLLPKVYTEYTPKIGTDTGPQYQRAAMSDKSPRQTMTKKTGKSLKEKRATKRGKADQASQTEALLHTKKK